ncbi:MAG TPA: aminotransferase class IV, partial [Alphaproteobacteria bacterium]|nr:aminotransferase class IV [Alphaproteobacteria bacterium]
MIVWLDGQLIDAEAVRIDPGDRGLTLGDGLFETIAVRGGNIALLAAHLARLRHGCAVLRLPYPDADCEAALRAVLDANKMTDAVLRLTLTRGAAPRGLLPPAEPRPALLISAAPLPPPAPAARCV